MELRDGGTIVRIWRIPGKHEASDCRNRAGRQGGGMTVAGSGLSPK
jgi:hypothetical protein